MSIEPKETNGNNLPDIPEEYSEAVQKMEPAVSFLKSKLEENSYSDREEAEIKTAIDYINRAGLVLIEGIEIEL